MIALGYDSIAIFLLIVLPLSWYVLNELKEEST